LEAFFGPHFWRDEAGQVAHGFVDLCPVAPFVGRQSHHSIMDVAASIVSRAAAL
jgi:hypothetical protein